MSAPHTTGDVGAVLAGARLPAPYYEHAGVTIYHGDCREIAPSIEADVVLTDPPYEIVATGGGIVRKRAYLGAIVGHTDMGFDLSILAPWPNWMVFCAKAQLRALLAQADDGAGRWALITWNKPNPTPLVNANYLPDTEYIVHRFEDSTHLHGRYEDRSRYIVCPSEPTGKVGHPNAKPLRVMRKLVSLASGAGQTVLDLYMGSGTTLVACKELGRRAIGIEREERYCELAAKRLSQQVLPMAVERTTATVDAAPSLFAAHAGAR